ncbi:SDR family oxidoreductase [Paraburkholderia acidisoli]|uniref:SDR family oxidoreductase n=1 Tax=Paraburkholderia acidisoli TaxID=2571748 RepID=A0A7Z2GPC1_9BURK|nr:SDR family NAD(P)-dependent oxidoreductase [Paraburkholderia acidisoli]QGZ65291.1 SDR family oxidoreductase [Paraburkholderia acidisoli]
MNAERVPHQARKVAVVTGGAGAMGFAIAKRLHETGLTVLLLDKDARVEALAAELGGAAETAKGFQVDLSNREQVEQFIATALREFGPCDVLVNNAGINLDKPDGSKLFTEDIDNESWDLMLNVNLRAPFVLCRGFVQGMKERGWGRIVNIASRAGRTYIPASNAHYSASKAGLIGMTRMIAGECGPFGITANCVAPGRVTSPIADRQSPEIIAQSMKNIPLARVGTPQEIAETVAFLCSDGAAYITGVTVDVNGGSFMG